MLGLRKRFSKKKKKKIISPKDVLFKTKSFKKKKKESFLSKLSFKKMLFLKNVSFKNAFKEKKNVFFFSLIWKTKFFKKKCFLLPRWNFLKEKKKYFEQAKIVKEICLFIKKIMRFSLEPKLFLSKIKTHEDFLREILSTFSKMLFSQKSWDF